MTNTFVEYVATCKEAVGDCGFRIARIDPDDVVLAASIHARGNSHAVQVVRHEVVERAVAAIDFRQ